MNNPAIPFAAVKKLAVICFLLPALQSCGRLAPLETHIDRSLHKTVRLTHPGTGREIILVPMCHLGTEKGYASVREYLDALKASGFVTFTEGLLAVPFHMDTVGEVSCSELNALMRGRALSAADSSRLDTLLRKLRRVIGMDITAGYNDPGNRSLPARYRRHDYIMQSDSLLGLTTEQDIWVDYTLFDLIGIYENLFGEIVLSDCDFRTGLNEKYKKDKSANDFMLTVGLRDRFIHKRIRESSHPKIAVVYGAGHIHFLKVKLKYLDGYTIDRKYKARTK